MTIDSTWIIAAGTVATVLVMIGVSLLQKNSSDRAAEKALEIAARQKEEDDGAEIVRGLKSSIKILFEKIDVIVAEHNAYKLHVAESYVNRAALKELLLPIERSIEELKKDIKERE